jgi:hypothetical protein
MIKTRFGPLAGRCDDTRTAIKASPEKLRAVAAKWQAWFQTKEFEDFAAKISKDR